jgi:hypothetical protein
MRRASNNRSVRNSRAAARETAAEMERIGVASPAHQSIAWRYQSIRRIITVCRLGSGGEGALQSIEIEYNQKLKALETILSGVRQPGDFFVCGAIEMPMPRVEIEGAGTLSFPVPDAQIADVIRRAERAPYGKGEATIIDTSVRKVWQVTADHVKIGGKSWGVNFDHVLSKVKTGLG